jgi:hypothetical protein
MLKGVTTKDGFVYVEMTPQEESEYLISNEPIWHDETREIQIFIPLNVKNDLLLKKQEHDILGNHTDIAMLLDYVKNINAPSYNEDEGLYIYLIELFEPHKIMLGSFGIQIKQKS